MNINGISWAPPPFGVGCLETARCQSAAPQSKSDCGSSKPKLTTSSSIWTISSMIRASIEHPCIIVMSALQNRSLLDSNRHCLVRPSAHISRTIATVLALLRFVLLLLHPPHLVCTSHALQLASYALQSLDSRLAYTPIAMPCFSSARVPKLSESEKIRLITLCFSARMRHATDYIQIL